MARYVKCRFYSEFGATAGLIFELDAKGRVVSPGGRILTLSDISRCYPMSEASKMTNYEVSDAYPSWEEAFDHKFPNYVINTTGKDIG